MATFKEFSPGEIRSGKDTLDQVISFIQSDISSSTTRRTYQLWVTAAAGGPGVTSSLYQTVYDQDFTLQTANPLFDITFGLQEDSTLVSGSGSPLTYIDSTTGKYYFASQSLMMREKMNIYRLHAQSLLGDADSTFNLTKGTTTIPIHEAMFIDVKRLFARDKIKRETFGIRLFGSASSVTGPAFSGSIYTDIGSLSNIEASFGGQVSTIVDSANTSNPVGLLYLDKGIAVLHALRVFDDGTAFSGSIDAANTTGSETFSGSFSQFMVSASIDDLAVHVCSTRFGYGSLAAMTFINQTFINSSMFFCRAGADEFNYSSNPTFTDDDGRIVVIDQGSENEQRSFTFLTSVGFYNEQNSCLAVGKFSRPILKNSDKDLTIKVRLDM